MNSLVIVVSNPVKAHSTSHKKPSHKGKGLWNGCYVNNMITSAPIDDSPYLLGEVYDFGLNNVVEGDGNRCYSGSNDDDDVVFLLRLDHIWVNIIRTALLIVTATYLNSL